MVNLRYARGMLTAQDIQKLPLAPGVYYFRDASGRILYIGKAKRIRDRVKQHLAAGYDGLKQDLLARTAAITYEVTETSLEAIIREGEAIKRAQPPYNILWKDDKNFFFIGVSHEATAPEIFLTHQPQGKIRNTKLEIRNKYKIKNSKLKKQTPATFFGPFVEKAPVQEIMRALRIIFGIKRDRLVRRARGWRVEGSSWREVVCELRLFFGQGVRGLLKQANLAMAEAAAQEDFERATYWRDKAARLKRFLQAQLVARAVAQEGREAAALNDVQTILGLAVAPRHIEGYDISNIQGTSAVASLVVARDGIMVPGEYKRFKIKTVRGANDVAMMREVLRRRLQHADQSARSIWPLPDLFLIDGGKPQVRAAVEALAAAGTDRPIVGLAKRDERLVVWRDGAWQEIHLDRARAGLQLLQRVRDESHRFARKYFHTLHRRRTLD